MAKPVVGITHSHEDLDTFFLADDLRELEQLADLRILGRGRDDGFVDRLAGVEILLGSWGMPKLTAALLDKAPDLRAVCYAAGTVKGFVTDAAYDRDITITTAMHANAIPVAEVTVALITLVNKGWFAAQQCIREHGRKGFPLSRKLPHHGNFGTAIGLIGFGAIGRLVLKHLLDMELSVLVYDPYVEPRQIQEAGATAVTELDELADRCHVISLHAPNIPECAGMLGKSFFTNMRDGGIFINTARGALVDEQALLAELQTGRISAHLDVTFPEPPDEGHPFYDLPNCYLTPHRAGSSAREVRRMGRWAVAEACRLLRGEPVHYQVHRDMLATMA